MALQNAIAAMGEAKKRQGRNTWPLVSKKSKHFNLAVNYGRRLRRRKIMESDEEKPVHCSLSTLVAGTRDGAVIEVGSAGAFGKAPGTGDLLPPGTLSFPLR